MIFTCKGGRTGIIIEPCYNITQTIYAAGFRKAKRKRTSDLGDLEEDLNSAEESRKEDESESEEEVFRPVPGTLAAQHFISGQSS